MQTKGGGGGSLVCYGKPWHPNPPRFHSGLFLELWIGLVKIRWMKEGEVRGVGGGMP